MNNVVLASSEADAGAVAAVEQHHAQMAGALAVRVEALLSAAARGDVSAAAAAQRELVVWCDEDL
ncbi:MAG TPA: hypothetical protein VJ794_08895, partial [Gemmatimonadales bacterium]|nr:hypothetical protein [Gemmatimonadales bacterium]